MATMLLIPLRDCRVLVHVLDDISPTDSSVVGAERNLSLLRAVRNNAHLSTSEIVVEKILEPHARDEKEVPTIGPSFCNVLRTSVTANLAVILPSQAERFVK